MSKEDLNRIFSNNLKYWLDVRGKTQADLYKKMGVSSATASDWCNYKKMPKADKLKEIAEWLMIELSDLLYEKEKEEVSDFEKVIYKIKDNNEFFSVVFDLYCFDEENYQKVCDYIKLLKK